MKMGEVTAMRTGPNWPVIATLALVIALAFFWPFLGVVCLAALMAYLFRPLYVWLSRRLYGYVAAMITLLINFAVVIIPIALVLISALSQAVSLAGLLAAAAEQPGSTLHDSAHPAVDALNQAMHPLTGGEDVVTYDSVRLFFKQLLPELINGLIKIVAGVVGNIPIMMTSVILYSYLFNMFLIYSGSMRTIFDQLSPFGRQADDLYIERAGSVVRASMLGQLLAAFVVAIGSTLVLVPLGLQSYFLFWLILFTLLGMVPLGGGIIVIPVCIIAMLTGQFWTGLWALLIYLFVVCNLDNFLRPRLMPKKAKLLPALTTLATFSGIYYFGVMGVVYGPLIAIILVTTYEAYMSARRELQQSKNYRANYQSNESVL